jgi:flagellar biosynthesis GTPase FlhF
MIEKLPPGIALGDFEAAALAFHGDTIFLQQRHQSPIRLADGAVVYDGKLSIVQDAMGQVTTQATLFGRAVTTKVGVSEEDSLVVIGVVVKKPSSHMSWMVHMSLVADVYTPTGAVYKGKTSCHPSLLVGDNNVMRRVNGGSMQRLRDIRAEVVQGKVRVLEATSLKKRSRPASRAASRASPANETIVVEDIDEDELDNLIAGLQQPAPATKTSKRQPAPALSTPMQFSTSNFTEMLDAAMVPRSGASRARSRARPEQEQEQEQEQDQEQEQCAQEQEQEQHQDQEQGQHQEQDEDQLQEERWRIHEREQKEKGEREQREREEGEQKEREQKRLREQQQQQAQRQQEQHSPFQQPHSQSLPFPANPFSFSHPQPRTHTAASPVASAFNHPPSQQSQPDAHTSTPTTAGEQLLWAKIKQLEEQLKQQPLPMQPPPLMQSNFATTHMQPRMPQVVPRPIAMQPMPQQMMQIQVSPHALHFLRGAASTQPALLAGLAEYVPSLFQRDQ